MGDGFGTGGVGVDSGWVRGCGRRDGLGGVVLWRVGGVVSWRVGGVDP